MSQPPEYWLDYSEYWLGYSNYSSCSAFQIEHDDGLGRHLDGELALLHLGSLELGGLHLVGMLEVVVVGYVLAGKDTTADILHLGVVEADLNLLGFVETDIGERENDAAVGFLGG